MKEDLDTGYPKFYLYKRIVQAKLFMDNQYHEKIDLQNISSEAFYSKFHFIRLFRKTFNRTPHQYLISVRLEKARLLIKSGVPISTACLEVGFESITTFTTLFRRVEKMTPSAFQKLHLSRKLEIKKVPLKFIPNCFAEQNGWKEKAQF